MGETKGERSSLTREDWRRVARKKLALSLGHHRDGVWEVRVGVMGLVVVMAGGMASCASYHRDRPHDHRDAATHKTLFQALWENSCRRTK